MGYFPTLFETICKYIEHPAYSFCLPYLGERVVALDALRNDPLNILWRYVFIWKNETAHVLAYILGTDANSNVISAISNN
eukprot:6672748-Pyramimonas_sp.AAC.1